MSFQEVAAVVDHVGESVYDKYSTAEDSLGPLMDSKDHPLHMLDESLKSEEMDADNILDSLGTDKYANNPYDIDLLNDDKMDIGGEVSLSSRGNVQFGTQKSKHNTIGNRYFGIRSPLKFFIKFKDLKIYIMSNTHCIRVYFIHYIPKITFKVKSDKRSCIGVIQITFHFMENNLDVRHEMNFTYFNFYNKMFFPFLALPAYLQTHFHTYRHEVFKYQRIHLCFLSCQ